MDQCAALSTECFDRQIPDGAFSREQAEAVVAQYCNVTIEDDQGTRFRLALRRTDGYIICRSMNDEAEGGAVMNRYIDRYGVKKQ